MLPWSMPFHIVSTPNCPWQPQLHAKVNRGWQQGSDPAQLETPFAR